MRNIIIALTLVTLTGCSGLFNSDSSDDNKDHQFSSFPLMVGNEWHYTITVQTTSTSNAIESTTTTGNLTVNITGTETILTTINSYIVEGSLTEWAQTFTRKTYQSNQEDGLYSYEFEGQNSGILLASIKTPPPQKSTKIYFKDQFFHTLKELVEFIEKQQGSTFIQPSLIQLSIASSSAPTFNSTPVKSLEYPLVANAQWVYRIGTNLTGDLAKKVLGQESITVDAGNFDSYKIQWLWDVDNNNEWDDDIIGYEYISTKGLIKKTTTVKNIASTQPVNNDFVVVGYFDMTIEYALTSYQL